MSFGRALALCAALAAGPHLAFGADEPPLNRALNEEILFIRNGSGLFSTELETTLFRPDGNGPFPLIVINHGKESGNPRFQARYRSIVAAREFVRRGYAVMLPMRGGFSRSSGSYIAGGCNTAGNGRAQAEDVLAAIDHARKLDTIDARRIVVVGQSHGGLTTMALGAGNPPGVVGLINFAGGLRLENCPGWESSLIAAFADYGASARMPSLWFYGDNDSYWSKPTFTQMHERYAAAGGPVRLVAFGRFKGDAHRLFGDRDGLAIWWPEVERFLAGLGLPTAYVPPAERPDPAWRRLQEAGAQIASADCRRVYALFLDADLPRAFAVSESGRCGYASRGDEPQRRAIRYCESKGDSPCRLLAVDDGLVQP